MKAFRLGLWSLLAVRTQQAHVADRCEGINSNIGMMDNAYHY